ncbi:fumarylacetoacetate hydrolase family protein [Tepidiphilus olei]|uniref:fumarylacetoacetate hydrolase family protein n=1 Tax=Tepidiphilus olei TaxID=2502184 RepID=UPI00115CEE7A|nr:fumarylacetoacetate hydrolase family protein [Tepidiphilus olei]
MKFIRFGAPGKERPGLVAPDGSLRDLSSHVNDIDGALLADEAALAALRALDPFSLPPVASDVRLGPPVAGVGNFYAIGLNFRDHAQEANLPIPGEPVVFMKATSCICGPNDPLLCPPGAQKLDWEAELGVVIGRRAKRVSPTEARACIAGYCTVLDGSERDFQMNRGGLWIKGKSYESFGPLGPWLVTADEVSDPQSLAIRLEVNGERMQDGTTAEMIFDVLTLVSHLSEFMTLLPGDVIATGTPAGVGLGQNPPRFLRPGDEVTLEVGGLGRQRHRVVADRAEQ